jgi:DNA mismatch repair protein MutS
MQGGRKLPGPDRGTGETSAQARPKAQQYCSVLFEQPEAAAVLEHDEVVALSDLHLDQVQRSMTLGREQFALEEFFYAPLTTVAAVRYRQDVLRDLENPEVRSVITSFGEAMDRERTLRGRAENHNRASQQESWFLDAADTYCSAVQELADGLASSAIRSRGLLRLSAYVVAYVASSRFTEVAKESAALEAALAGIRYRLRIESQRVTVSPHEESPDYSLEIGEAFSRFQQHPTQRQPPASHDIPEISEVEARILDGVMQLFPEVFEARARFCAHHRDYRDEAIVRFDREVRFFLGYLELIEPLRAAGLPLCYPDVDTEFTGIAAAEAFDLALASKRVGAGRSVVCNDFHLEGSERILVVSGPNNGGKTTFARTFGQLHHLARLGLSVPGRSARLFLTDRIFAHFEREEDVTTLSGKFDEELVRVREMLELATPNSVIVMNESFNSTSLSDALFVGTEVVHRIVRLGCLGVYVTFVEEIASLGPATVSMVAQIVPDDPAQRTFRVIRQPPSGLAYAWAIADKYGLSYAQLMELIDA